MRGMDQRFWIGRARRAVIALRGNCGHRLPFIVKKPRMIRIFAPLACPGRTIEASFACVWVLVGQVLDLLVNLPDHAAPASCRLLCGKTPAPGKSRGPCRGEARRRQVECAESDVHAPAFPRVLSAVPERASMIQSGHHTQAANH